MKLNTRKSTVYIVDDDPAVLGSLKWLIEAVGHRVECFASADEFLASDYLAEAGCLLLDVRMPGMDGLELHSRIARNPQCPPVIFITGHGDVPMAVQAMRSGAFDFLEKPLGDPILLERIEQAIKIASRSAAAQGAPVANGADGL